VVSQNLIGSTADIDRKLSMGVGILLENVSNISLSKATISGFLFGIRMADCHVVDVDRSWVDQCSVGLYVDKSKSEYQELQLQDDVLWCHVSKSPGQNCCQNHKVLGCAQSISTYKGGRKLIQSQVYLIIGHKKGFPDKDKNTLLTLIL
jgi:hypothetical protein